MIYKNKQQNKFWEIRGDVINPDAISYISYKSGNLTIGIGLAEKIKELKYKDVSQAEYHAFVDSGSVITLKPKSDKKKKA